MKTCRFRRRICALYAGLIIVIFMHAVAFAAPPDSQPQPTNLPQEISFPDIKAIELVVDRLSPQAGDIIFFKGTYMVTGCVKKPFFGKITLDGKTLIEQEMKNYNPDCIGSNIFDGLFGVSWKAAPGAHTIVFTADSKNDVAEGPLKENNNTKTITLVVPFPPSDIRTE